MAASKEQVRVHFKEVHKESTQIETVAVKVKEEEKTVAEESDDVKLTLE